MKKLLLIGMVCYGLSAGAQMRPSENFIYLNSDSVIYAKSIKLRPDAFNSLQLRADSRRIPLQQVKFFNNQDGFFANTRKYNFGRETEFAERIIEGKINLFQQVNYAADSYHHRFRNRRNETVDIRMYYNKGYEELKKVSYQNLQTDMANNPESMEFLKNYKKSINTRNYLYAGAGASIVAGLITFLITGLNDQKSFKNEGFPQFGNLQNSKTPNFTASFALLGIGTGLAFGGYAVGNSSSRHLENAVDAYNR